MTAEPLPAPFDFDFGVDALSLPLATVPLKISVRARVHRCARQTDPLKQWKLSPIDLASFGKWEEYTRAKEEMFFHTDTADAPWTVIKSDNKMIARLNCMRFVLDQIPYEGKDEDVVGKPDPAIVGSARVVFERGERMLEMTELEKTEVGKNAA